jgi:hypothetical protein
VIESVRALGRGTFGATALGSDRDTRGAVSRGATLSRRPLAASGAGDVLGLGGAGSGPRGGVHAETSSAQSASARDLEKHDSIIVRSAP